MAHRVVWLRAAEQDLDAIADYIADDSPAYASAVVQKMLAAAANLAEFPLIGKAVPEWSDKTIRELLVYTYRLIYRIDNDSVLVLAVIHGARLLPDVLRERR